MDVRCNGEWVLHLDVTNHLTLRQDQLSVILHFSGRVQTYKRVRQFLGTQETEKSKEAVLLNGFVTGCRESIRTGIRK